MGAGSWGTALSVLLARNGHEVLLWGRDRRKLDELARSRENKHYLPGQTLPRNIFFDDSLGAVLENSKVAVLAVPVAALPELLEKISPWFGKESEKILVGTAKGLDKESGQTPHQVLRAILGSEGRRSSLCGPSFAAEVAADKPTAVTIVASDLNLAHETGKYFGNPNFRVYFSDDVIGVEIASALKNTLAIATGISDGLGLGANARAALITRGLYEISKLAVAMGAKKETLYGLSGVGDIVLTCCGGLSRNRRFGLLLAQGKEIKKAIAEIGQVVEGMSVALAVRHLAKQHRVDLPICSAVADVVEGIKSPLEAVATLLARKNVPSSGKEA